MKSQNGREEIDLSDCPPEAVDSLLSLIYCAKLPDDAVTLRLLRDLTLRLVAKSSIY